jgi:uncharacterized membrane protein
LDAASIDLDLLVTGCLLGRVLAAGAPPWLDRRPEESSVAASTTHLHRWLLLLVGVVVVATAAGVVALWPPPSELPRLPPLEDQVHAAEIVWVELAEGEPDPLTGAPVTIATIMVELRGGPARGEVHTLAPVSLEVFPMPRMGDRVEVEMVLIDDEAQFYLRDFRRLPTLGWLVALFVLAVLAIGRWQGLRSVVGLGLSLLIVVKFIVPSILAGNPPPVVAMVGAMAIMIVTLYLSHGFNAMTTSAVVGTGAALAATIGLALVVLDRGHVTGFGSEEAVLARFAVAGLDLQGLVLAGLIIASLGVLDDVTISQASTVFALHDTDPRLTWRALFGRAMKVGRDHIASVVNTLFLAYTGASLALLVLFSTGGLPVEQILNSEVLAEEIVKTVVGSLGLIAAVPFTTALAAAVAIQRPAGARAWRLGHDGHVHHSPGASRRAAATSDGEASAALLAAVDARIAGSVNDGTANWEALRRGLDAVGLEQLDGLLVEAGAAPGPPSPGSRPSPRRRPPEVPAAPAGDPGAGADT